jgi:hypothetical protein
MNRLLSFCMTAILFLATSVTFLPSAKAACVASARTAKFADGSVKMKAYSCSLNDSGDAVVQVEFDRLSEAAAGGVIESSYADLNALYRSASVLHNEVYREAKSLFDSYGVKINDWPCPIVQVSSAEGGSYRTGQEQAFGCNHKHAIWYLSFPDSEPVTKGYPERWRPKIVNNKWPSTWNFYYGDCAKATDLLSCTMLWRYVNQSDLDNYLRDVRANEVKIGAPMVKSTDAPGDDSRDVESDRYFSFINHIARGNLPDDFMVLVDSDPVACGCGGPPGDGIHIRKLLMHTASIRNVSDSPITIDGLNSGSDDSSELRPYSDGQQPSSFATTPMAPVTISPGDTLIIPLRLNFVPADSLDDAFHDLTAAKRTYRLIDNSSGEFISGRCDTSPVNVRKSAFLPPTRPSANIYSYGPAIVLSGISIDGAEVAFDRPLSNFFQVVAAAGYGSCPYVYAIDAGEREWVRHGKVIDNASSPAKEMTQRLDLAGLVTRFKISEEELELSFVHKVRLELALADGRTITLRPRNRLRPESPDHYDKIKYNTEREYDFDILAGVDPANVRKSTLAVTGYYLRYSSVSSIDDQRGD